MRDPNIAIPEESTPALWRRYDEWRGQRYQRFNEQHAHRLIGWRNRRGYRRLVVLLALMLAILLASTIMAFALPGWFFIPFVAGLLGVMAALYLLRIATGSIADSPVSALDEIQLAQRNSARSIGLFVMFTLMFIPYLILIVISAGRDQVAGDLVYGTAVLLVALLLTAMCVPTMLVAWWMDDPDPEDLALPQSRSSQSQPPERKPHDKETIV
ncbi:hypothetical protein Gbro_1275 [Gordonia bronchialis DSM 43247]|uniref:Transmembrane protein n=1 Tax=Gordonia bronchialis (strain ATCC 25592 / DSM 43247 / BCRC 13721 / JCM 3198 / KCTC 3076 / NBRC 16047 / NCTC 10667) TaxID=526226 RepID=D0L5N8_GORB4|nr:hypothetical protein [Gordonia bronchialis]ACY20567.1 hypothetical protein Gbro_1275 [Gordonia bronchialis DSM 43247]MCC3323341.1 hypothetical protein [Gordonia bronchialis]QGS25661.1 hypothetical protein FOB84_17475 [Gordonia bronchialis]UAK37936.1 hypothetical protein K8O93_23340 [Gordonia bronchialis]STQ63387.1 Uncharacterised protein [Gordonia bronchialis]